MQYIYIARKYAFLFVRANETDKLFLIVSQRVQINFILIDVCYGTISNVEKLQQLTYFSEKRRNQRHSNRFSKLLFAPRNYYLYTRRIKQRKKIVLLYCTANLTIAG